MHVAGFGRVLFWQGGSLWLGLVTGGAELHAHHALQISLPVTGTVRFREAHDSEATAYAGALITPDLPHAFEAPGRVVANLLFEPESAVGRAILARHPAAGIYELPAAQVATLVAPLAAAYFDEAEDGELVAAAQGIVTAYAGVSPAAPSTDRRVLAAIAYIRDSLDEPIELAALARKVGLSPGRFRHLFVSQTGVSSKAFVLWERLNRALSLGYSGQSWTEAAHAANFADSAHLSRTCRRMFGLSPTSAHIEPLRVERRLTA